MVAGCMKALRIAQHTCRSSSAAVMSTNHHSTHTLRHIDPPTHPPISHIHTYLKDKLIISPLCRQQVHQLVQLCDEAHSRQDHSSGPTTCSC